MIEPMKSLLTILALTLVVALSISSSQDSPPRSTSDAEELLREGRALQKDGKYLLAAQIFHSVQSRSVDTNQQAEAIYRYVKWGYPDQTVLKYLRRRQETPYDFFCCC